jgi:uncharacterized protein DUF983
LRPRCEVCGLDYGFADSGDGPAVFIMFVAGFIVVGAALVTEVLYRPPYWVHAALWLPLILVVTLGPLTAAEGIDDCAAVLPQGRREALRRSHTISAGHNRCETVAALPVSFSNGRSVAT